MSALDSMAPDGCMEYGANAGLQISVDGGEFMDILAAGGYFMLGGGGYGNGWIGTSPEFPGYSTVDVRLPEAARGSTVVLRWRFVAVGGVYTDPGGEWWVDSVRVCDGFGCDAVMIPAKLEVDTTGNGVLEAGEITDVAPAYLGNTDGSYELIGQGSGFLGPSGVVPDVEDFAASYGTIQPGAISSCTSAADCYAFGFEDGGIRPAQHWDEQFLEYLQLENDTVAWALHIGGSFDDVPASNPFYAYVETVLHRGVTGGCGGTSYCPAAPALRKQMAVFLLKSKYGAAYVPPPATGIFADVPTSDPFAGWIENLYALGITGGCGSAPLTFCPDQTVLRKQMAVFLLKTLNGTGYVPPACQGVFADVPCPSPFADWIEALYTQQIAAGCGNGVFCPDNPNTRGQMAVFLTKNFGLTLYGP